MCNRLSNSYLEINICSIDTLQHLSQVHIIRYREAPCGAISHPQGGPLQPVWADPADRYAEGGGGDDRCLLTGHLAGHQGILDVSNGWQGCIRQILKYENSTTY